MFVLTHQSHPESRDEFDEFSKKKKKKFQKANSAKCPHDLNIVRVILLNMCLKIYSVSTTREICKKVSNSINLTPFDQYSICLIVQLAKSEPGYFHY